MRVSKDGIFCNFYLREVSSFKKDG